MPDLEDALTQQSVDGEEIQRIISNFKKDLQDRKTVEYYKTRITALQQLVEGFKQRNKQILESPDCPKIRTHPYFANDFYISTMTVANQYMKMMKEALDSKTSTSQAITQPSQITPSIRRQHALERLLQVCGQSPVEEQIRAVQDLWVQTQQLHYTIYEACDHPEAAGYNSELYIILEAMVLQLVGKGSRLNQTSTTTTQPTSMSTAIALPKLTIPKFDGDYLKWKQFFDIFSQMVDQQPLPDIQKMWYLKANVAGEAERVICHINATAENYSTAWSILQDRFDNKRLITSNLVQKILNIQNLSDGASSNSVKFTTPFLKHWKH